MIAISWSSRPFGDRAAPRLNGGPGGPSVPALRGVGRAPAGHQLAEERTLKADRGQDDLGVSRHAASEERCGALNGVFFSLRARNATLRIESARSYDEGTYVCDASNALGRSRATLTLVVAGMALVLCLATSDTHGRAIF